MVLSPLGSPKRFGFGEGILEEQILRAGIENFPLWMNREVRQGERKRGESSKREGVPIISQKVILVCFEMGVPYFKVSRGTRPGAEECGDPSA